MIELLLIFRAIHVLGFVLGIAFSFTLLTYFIIFREKTNRSRLIMTLAYITILQIVANIASAISGISRLIFNSTVISGGELNLFELKMFFFALSIGTVFFLLVWWRRLLVTTRRLVTYAGSLTSKQIGVSLILLLLNVSFLSFVFILGGFFSIL